jgi:hypothetical protein
MPQGIRAVRRSLASRRRTTMCTVGLALIAPLASFAQSNSVPERIAAQINESSLTTLRGNTHPLARPQFDQGRVDPALKMERITMMFQRTVAQKADLEALLAAQQNPASPSFHRWLTPAQFGERFGIAQTDLQKVTAWLQARGLNVVETPDSKNFIVFEGTAAQVESALHTEMHAYATSDTKFYSNSSEPSAPAELAAVVSGFRGLNNFRMKPRAVRKNPASGAPLPDFTSSISGNNFVAPGDFAKIYDLNPLYGASPAIDGTGQKIVIVGQSNIVPADIAAFRTASGLPANAAVVTLVPSSTDPGVLSGTGDEQESSIDIEWAGAVAKNATVDFVYSGNGVNDALQYAVSQNFAPVISISYGNCEAMNPLSEVESLVSIAQQANSQGITIVSSVGDGGATDCDSDLGNYPAILGLNVDVPASLPYVTGVGGTEFDEGTATSTYWLAATSKTDALTSAISYIPEKVWNDSSATNGLSAGGGGASTLFAKPTWQTGTGVPTDGARDVPDMSLNASSTHDPYLVCVQFIPSKSSTFTSSCLNGTFRYSDTTLQAYGGTSFGAPTFAGILALVNQKTASAGQGNVNYILYPLAASTASAFHDITTGDNKSPCIVGTQDCTPGGSIGFLAIAGYDRATGLGSIDAANLVNAWSSVTPAAGSTPTLTSISPMTITAGSADFTLTATGSGFATNAQILWNGSASGVTMLPGGTATTITATISHNLVAYGTTASVSATDDAAKAGESTTSLPFTVTGTPPVNDHIAGAIAMTINSTSTVDNSAATTDTTDPTPPCALTGPSPSTNPRTKTVWWTVTSATTQSLIVSTIGSVYDTTLSVWTGTPGNLATSVACNDDVSSGQYTQSMLSFSATAGTTYYIMVAPFGPPDTGPDLAGGKTVLNVSAGNLSSISATPAAQTVAAGSSVTFIITDVGSASLPLTCSGLPTGAACAPVTVSAGSTASLVITTTSRSGVVPPSKPSKRLRIDLWPATLSLLGISFLAFLALGRHKALKLVPTATVALMLMLFASGCGSSGSTGGGTNPNPTGTPAGTYTITVTGSASVSTTVKLTVT